MKILVIGHDVNYITSSNSPLGGIYYLIDRTEGGERNNEKVLLIAGGILLVIIVLASASGGNKGSKPTNTSSNAGSQITPIPEKISARDLADDFDANQVAAEAKWKDKFVQFSAQISNITDRGISFHSVATKEFSLTQISCRIQDKQQLLPLKKRANSNSTRNGRNTDDRSH